MQHLPYSYVYQKLSDTVSRIQITNYSSTFINRSKKSTFLSPYALNITLFSAEGSAFFFISKSTIRRFPCVTATSNAVFPSWQVIRHEFCQNLCPRFPVITCHYPRISCFGVRFFIQQQGQHSRTFISCCPYERSVEVLHTFNSIILLLQSYLLHWWHREMIPSYYFNETVSYYKNGWEVVNDKCSQRC